MNSFSSCHRFSIGLQSGDSAGVFHQLTPSACRNCATRFDVCLGSLSCISRLPLGYTSRRNGSRACRSMLSYPSAFITPSNITMGVLPSQLIPPQMCTFTGCLALEMNKWEVKHAKYKVYMQSTCTCTCIHVCMCVYTYIHTHLHIHVHVQLTSFESLTSVWVLVVLPFFSNYGASCTEHVTKPIILRSLKVLLGPLQSICLICFLY